jgi:periplasmic protein TonB
MRSALVRSGYQHQRSNKAVTGLGAVVFLHLGAIWLLNSGMSHKIVDAVKKTVEVRLVEPPKLIEPPAPPPLPPPPPKREPPPPPPKKTLAPPPPKPLAPPPPAFVPKAEVQIAAPPPAVVAVTPDPPPPAAKVELAPAPVPAPAPPKAEVRAATQLSASCDKPEYPPASQRMQEEGRVVLRLIISADGRVVESKVDKSSGYTRLDEAARQALALCRFKPATADGQPIQSNLLIPYRFELPRD